MNTPFIWPDSPQLRTRWEIDSEEREAEAATKDGDWLDYTPEETERAARELEIEYGHKGEVA